MINNIVIMLLVDAVTDNKNKITEIKIEKKLKDEN